MRIALLFALLPSFLFLAGCDAAAPEPLAHETAAGTQAWVAAADAPALDVLFSTLTTSPGGIIRAMFERPDDGRLTLSSAHQPLTNRHRIELEASGLEVEGAELLIRRIQDASFVSVKSAKNLSEITGQVDREPQSVHYEEVVYENGDTAYLIRYDYERTGARFQSDHTKGEIEIDNVGYRVQLNRYEEGFSQLRIDGYDRLAVASMRALTAPEMRARAHQMLPAQSAD
jgi:hypothetical protein